MILGIDPKVDYAFKRVFGIEKNRKVLASLLNSVLKDVGSEFGPVDELELKNLFIEKDHFDDKLSILDIKAHDRLGRWFNVEMQMLAHPDFVERLLYYWAKLFAEQLKEGSDWELLKPTVSICFVNSVMFHEVTACHSVFQLLDPRHGHRMTDRIEMHVIELPKFNRTADGLAEDLDRWLYFLRHAAELDSQALPRSLQWGQIPVAVEELAMITHDTYEQQLYEARMKHIRDENSYRRAGLKKGRAEGLAEGLAEGREEGLAIGKAIAEIQLCQRLLELPMAADEDLEKLAPNERAELSESLWKRIKK